MKVICVWKNLKENIRSKENTCFYLKPETSLLLKNRPFYYPEYTDNIEGNVELVLRINKVGKYISKKFAHTYYDEIGLGMTLTAKDLMKKQSDAGLPTDISYSFDNSAPLGNFVDKKTFSNLHDISFSLTKNNEIVQKGHTSEMQYSFDEIISYISQYIMIKTGDLIFTGAIAEGVQLRIGDHLECFINNESFLKLNIK